MNVIGATGLSNYYGEVEIVEKDGKYYLTLENYDTLYGVEISAILANMMLIEFKEAKEEIDMWEEDKQ